MADAQTGAPGFPLPSREAMGAAIQKALDLLAECLNDDDSWEAEALVERMEAAFFALGGTLKDES